MILHFTDRIEGDSLWLSDEEFRHCVKSLRRKVGDEILVFDKTGNIHTAKILTIDSNALESTIISTKQAKRVSHHITMVVSPTKSPDRVEWMIAKAVEIGVQSIILVHTARTERTRHKMDRIEKIAFASAKQSLNLVLPSIIEVDTLDKAIAMTQACDKKFIAHCMDPKEHLMRKHIMQDSKIVFLIGPEGDFTTEELDTVKAQGYEEISLGSARLRTETAGIVALTLINGMLQSLD